MGPKIGGLKGCGSNFEVNIFSHKVPLMVRYIDFIMTMYTLIFHLSQSHLLQVYLDAWVKLEIVIKTHVC